MMETKETRNERKKETNNAKSKRPRGRERKNSETNEEARKKRHGCELGELRFCIEKPEKERNKPIHGVN